MGGEGAIDEGCAVEAATAAGAVLHEQGDPAFDGVCAAIDSHTADHEALVAILVRELELLAKECAQHRQMLARETHRRADASAQHLAAKAEIMRLRETLEAANTESTRLRAENELLQSRRRADSAEIESLKSLLGATMDENSRNRRALQQQLHSHVHPAPQGGDAAHRLSPDPAARRHGSPWRPMVSSPPPPSGATPIPTPTPAMAVAAVSGPVSPTSVSLVRQLTLASSRGRGDGREAQQADSFVQTPRDGLAADRYSAVSSAVAAGRVLNSPLPSAVSPGPSQRLPAPLHRREQQQQQQRAQPQSPQSPRSTRSVVAADPMVSTGVALSSEGHVCVSTGERPQGALCFYSAAATTGDLAFEAEVRSSAPWAVVVGITAVRKTARERCSLRCDGSLSVVSGPTGAAETQFVATRTIPRALLAPGAAVHVIVKWEASERLLALSVNDTMLSLEPLTLPAPFANCGELCPFVVLPSRGDEALLRAL